MTHVLFDIKEYIQNYRAGLIEHGCPPKPKPRFKFDWESGQAYGEPEYLWNDVEKRHYPVRQVVVFRKSHG